MIFFKKLKRRRLRFDCVKPLTEVEKAALAPGHEA